MPKLSCFLTSIVLFGCGGDPFTVADSRATPDAGKVETSDIDAVDAAGTLATDPADAGTVEVEPETRSIESGSGSGDSGLTSEETGLALDARSGDVDAADASNQTTTDSGTATCTPGATQCASATQVETCGANGQLGAATTCPYACTGGACGGSCVPGSAKCDSAMVIETCQPNGTWGVPTLCGSCETTQFGGICV